MKSRVLLFLILSTSIVACGGGSSSQNKPAPPLPPDPAPPKELLISTTVDSNFVAAFAQAMQSANTAQRLRTTDAILASDSSSSAEASTSNSFTTTYTQETSVDEHDIVKYDGQYLYIAPSNQNSGCCYVVEDGIANASADVAMFAPIPESDSERTIRIVATDSDNATVSELSQLKVPDDLYVEGLYHNAERLTSIATSAWYGTFGDTMMRVEPWANQYTQIDIFDTADIISPASVGSIGIEGSLINTRRTAKGIHVVTRHSPVIEDYVYYPADDAEKTRNEEIIKTLTSKDLIAKIKLNGEFVASTNLENCYFSNTNSPDFIDFNEYPTITTVTTIDPQDASIVDSFCLMSYSDGIYIAEDDIVFTQNYYTDEQNNGLFIHQFSLSANNHYEGSARTDGRLYLGGNQDFRISRYKDTLRLVTSQWMKDPEDNIDHTLHIFDSNASDGKLSKIATLPNKDRPEEIGKPNEDLYGVRFMGDKAYLVTFERTDPLYVIDLTNSQDPKIAGDLEIPGFSNFLHPVNESLLLGLGVDANRHVKLALFDISDMSNPILRSEFLVAPDLSWPYSEAEYDRHAFTYQSNSSQDRFTIPVSGWDEAGQYQRQQLHLFDLMNKTDASTASINSNGFIEVNNLPDGEYPDYRNRAIIHNDAVFYINGSKVFSAQWNNPSMQVGPQ